MEGYKYNLTNSGISRFRWNNYLASW